MAPAVTMRPSPAMTSVEAPTTKFGMHAVLHIGVARLADADDETIAQADVGFDDAPMIDNQRVGDDGVEHAIGARGAATLAHAVADDFAAAEFDFFAVNGEIALDARPQFGVGQTDAIARRRAIGRGVGRALHVAHRLLPIRRDALQRRRNRSPCVRSFKPNTCLVAANFNEGDRFFFARLEAHGGSGGNVETHVEGWLAVELERAVDLEKAEMRADLNRPVAGVGDIDWMVRRRR